MANSLAAHPQLPPSTYLLVDKLPSSVSYLYLAIQGLPFTFQHVFQLYRYQLFPLHEVLVSLTSSKSAKASPGDRFLIRVPAARVFPPVPHFGRDACPFIFDYPLLFLTINGCRYSRPEDREVAGPAFTSYTEFTTRKGRAKGHR